MNMMMRQVINAPKFFSDVFANIIREWYRNLKEDGVKVWCVSPGYLATGLGGSRDVNKSQGAADPAIGGQFVKDVIEGRRDEDVGKVILRDRVQAW